MNYARAYNENCQIDEANNTLTVLDKFDKLDTAFRAAIQTLIDEQTDREVISDLTDYLNEIDVTYDDHIQRAKNNAENLLRDRGAF